MALQLPDMSAAKAAFKAVPANQKIALLMLLVIGIGAGFYYLVEEPESQKIQVVTAEVEKLDQEIAASKEKIKHLAKFKQLIAELEIQLARNQEQLPPESEAVTVLKQLSDLGTRTGLTLRFWRPGARQEDPSKLFVKLPADVEMVGGYHTLALFFDRINKLPRIINVNKIRMGPVASGVAKDQIAVQATFQLTVFASPSAPVAPAGGAKPPGK